MLRPLLLVIGAALFWSVPVRAHHSFSAYFGPSEPQGFATLEGTVSEFRYTNPHGILLLVVLGSAGTMKQWTIETLAPAMLSRTGWSRDSLKRGDRVKVQGWRARDGSNLLRLQTVTRDDGSVLGLPGAAKGAAPAAQAQARPSSPDIGGTWSPTRYAPGTASPRSNEASRRFISPAATLMRDPVPPIFEFARGDFGGLQIQADALKRAQRWQPTTEPSVSGACSPASILQAMTSPFPIEIDPTPKLVAIRLEYFDLTRLVFMDGRPHPGPGYPHSKMGHSVGRLQDGVLIVDTTHLSPSLITMNGLTHTQNMHVIEHFWMSADGATLNYTQEFNDPTVLKAPGARYAQFKRHTGNVMPYDCDPSYAASIRNREGR